VTKGRDELLARIAAERARLDALGRQRDQVKQRLDALYNQLAVLDDGPHTNVTLRTPVPRPGPRTAGDKVRLFRALFRGRTDVFPSRFVSRRTGDAGYAPACSNKFVPGVCDLPRIKCGDCPNQAFQSVDDRAILNHLQGRHVMGVYPLLSDDTCWLLAVDFDGESWTDDVAAFTETCQSLDLPVSVERSRSGNGAHIWFFFVTPVAAATARRMGCYLITETMSRRHQLSMRSYDRFFPNQDTMPRGGFGNLIALPLQHEARRQANTMFIDRRLEPYPDQWAYLASIPRLEPTTVEAIAEDAARTGRVIGVRFAESREEDARPWEKRLSRTLPSNLITESLPSTVRAVLAQRLFVEKRGLPSPLVDRIKRLAAFQNPEFYKKQKMRLSTALTPRVIVCAEELSQYIALPRGLRADVAHLLEHHGVTQKEIGRMGGGRRRLTGALDVAMLQSLVRKDSVHESVDHYGHVIVDEGRSPIVLTERRDHLESLAERLKGFVRNMVVLRGGMTSRERKQLSARMDSIPEDEERLVLATGRYIGEGFDDSRLDTLFLAMPVSWKGTLAQYTGRLHRLHPGKREVRIYDYVDVVVPMLRRMFEKRMRAYVAIGYSREGELEDIEPVRERYVQYDVGMFDPFDGRP